jgi:hypothetical protein
MGSFDTKTTKWAVTCGAMWLAACGGGEGNPRPMDGAGAGGTGVTGGSGGTGAASGSGGTGGGNTGGSAGMMPVDECPSRTPRTGGMINELEAVGAEGEHRRFPTNDGGWFIYHASPEDAQCGDTCTTTPPRDGHGDFTLTPTMPERSGSENALHFVGTGFTGSAYGGGVGFYLDCASIGEEITGVSFYYRSDIPVTFGLATGLEGAATDHMASLVASPDEWTHAQISLDSLSPSVTDRSVFGTLFWRLVRPAGVSTDWEFDFWLDDVSWIPDSESP